MVQTVFVNVVGFTDAERHALNSLFRLSVEQETKFFPWEPQAPQGAKLALIDGDSYEARVELASPRNSDVPIIWIGSGPSPQQAIRSFQRPIAWGAVLQAMDELVGPLSDPIDFDVDFGVDTLPPDADGPATLPPDEPQRRRALIVNADRDERLYVRAKLALAGLCEADEAESAAQALELARDNNYVLAVVDFHLPDADGWKLFKELAEGPRPVGKVLITKTSPSIRERMRAKFVGVAGVFEKPLHPAKLHDALLRV